MSKKLFQKSENLQEITSQKLNLFSIIDQLFAKLLSHATYQQATIEIADGRCFNKASVKSSTSN